MPLGVIRPSFYPLILIKASCEMNDLPLQKGELIAFFAIIMAAP